MEVIPLSQVSIEEKVRCFNAAFSDYFVQINMTADYFRERHQMGRVDYDYSFGIWAEGKLCAFIYSGLGSWAGAPTVYNAGTGVIPAFRGQHLVSRIYETALPFWAARGYRQTLLEVITDNVKAIRVYERVGFRKQRRFHIYSGLSDLPVSSAVPELDIQIVDRPDWAAYAPLLPFQPSWEYNQAGVEALINGFHFLHAYVQGALQAFLILQPQTGTILQFGYRPQAEGAALALFSKALSISGKLRTLNVETTSPAVNFLDSIHFPKVVDQYEMLKKW